MAPTSLFRLCFLLTVSLSLNAIRTHAEEPSSHATIQPRAQLTTGAGASTADDPTELTSGGHDPDQNGAYLQGLELGLSLYVGDHLEGFANYNVFSNPNGGFGGEWEEAFLKIIHLPGGAELKGGRFLNHFGLRNSLHLHDWNTVDQNLVVGRLLGEEGLQSLGGEIAIDLPLPGTPVLSLSAGEVPPGDHQHHHDEGESEEVHGHFEADLAGFGSTFFSADLRLNHTWKEAHRFTHTLSAAWGENGFEELTQIYGAGFEYAYQPTGQNFPRTRFQTETIFRHFEARDEEGHRGDFGELGVYAMIAQSVSNRFDLYLRGEFISGVPEAELEERWRVSPGATFYLNSQRSAHLRLQYNYDHGEERGTDHSVWAQVGIALDPGNTHHGHAHHHSH